MAKRYIFRLDDISWDMNYENFSRIRDLFFQYNIRPIIGVIPANADEKLKTQVGERRLSQEEFWAEMRALQHEHGWAVALHGYDHVYITADSGMFGINPRAEFAGLPYDRQEEKLRRGKAVLEEHGLTVDAFMAPSHSMDWTTVEALKANGIFTVTDGLGVYPYRKNGVLFVPQTWAQPWWGICGYDTVCFHVNLWKEKNFKRIERFFQKSSKKCTSFQELCDNAAQFEGVAFRICHALSCNIIPAEKKCVKTIMQLRNGNNRSE